jgi:trans-2,3-dihydro-3-hydroxyanthranilate isomerase
MPAYHYLHLDVFTDRPFEGNQLAVFRDARGLTSLQMQRIAREINFSETTFVLPPERDDTDVRMRIFTPGFEIPMAGHPTIGTTFALAHLGLIKAGQARLTFGLNIGPTRVDLEWEGDRLRFAWMAQQAPVFGPPLSPRDAAPTALGLRADDLSPDLPVQEVSTGLPFLFVPIATRRAVDAAEPDATAIERLSQRFNTAEQSVFFFTTEPGDDGATAYSRMFAPAFGIPEDPATGGASGPLGCYLVRHGLVRAAAKQRIVSVQGVKMGRPSRIHIAVDGTPQAITGVRVGGQSVLVAEGELRVGG